MNGKKAKSLRKLAYKQAEIQGIPALTEREKVEYNPKTWSPLFPSKLLSCRRKLYQDLKVFYKVLQSKGQHVL